MAKSKTKLTFAVTFEQADGVTVAVAREAIRELILKKVAPADTEVKVHLLNRETTYAKR